MEQIITNELIQYKSGFLEGKREVIDSLALGKVIDLNGNEEEILDNNFWYAYGVNDGREYFSDLLDKGELELFDRNKTNEIIKECFGRRVIEVNKEGKEASVKFKM